MNVTPLDLQVLFTKAVDHAANLGKNDAANEAAQFVQNEEQTKESLDADDVVKGGEIIDDTNIDDEFVSVDEDGHTQEEFDDENNS